MKNGKVKKAVILAAGFGTRFLPATKASPKEMLPVLDTPAIQLSVEEAVAAGIEDIVIVTGASKRAIEDHFDANIELENALRKNRKFDYLKAIQRIQKLAHFIYVRQSQPLGTGHATLMAEAVVGDEPFVMMYPDDRIVGTVNPVRQMIDVYSEYESPVMGLFRVPKDAVSKYGIAKVQPIKKNVYEVLGIIEKPSPKEAPSNLASLKGYVLPPTIFRYLRKVKKGKGGEIILADAVDLYNRDRAVFGCELKGDLYDLGSKLGWLKANIAEGLQHKELGPELKRYLRTIQ